MSLTLAVFLLAAVAAGGMDPGQDPPIQSGPSEPLEPRAAPSHPLSLSKTSTSAGDRFADLVVLWSPGDDGAATGDPTATLGRPDFSTTGLGRTGCITLALTDGLILNDRSHRGADLRVFEDAHGFEERARLSVSLDGVVFQNYGMVAGGVSDVDLSSQVDLPAVRYLRFEDLGHNVYSNTATSGYDLNAVEALSFVRHPDPNPTDVAHAGVPVPTCGLI